MKKTRSVIIFVTLCILGLISFGLLFYDAAVDLLESVLPSKTETVRADPQPKDLSAERTAPTPSVAPFRLRRELPSWCLDAAELNGDFYSSVENDPTGTVRELRIYSGTDVSRYALSYYYAYFASDDEIHYIVDSSGWSGTWRLRVDGDQLLVDRFEAVPGEDQDGSRLGTGALIASYQVGLSDWTARQLSGERYEEEAPPVEEETKRQYVANSRSKVFHLPTCADVANMNEENKVAMYTTREEMIAQDYHPCGHCNP